jgi:hypothetical protein
MDRKQRNRCKKLTAAFLWPSKAFPKKKLDWDSIADELLKLAEDELIIRNNPTAALEAANLAGLCFEEETPACPPTLFHLVKRLINHAAKTDC